MANAILQYLTQICRFIWSSYTASQSLPGVALINITFVGAILCGMISGMMQGCAESDVRKHHPGDFPPTPLEIAKLAWKAERQRIRAEMAERAADRKRAPAEPADDGVELNLDAPPPESPGELPLSFNRSFSNGQRYSSNV